MDTDDGSAMPDGPGSHASHEAGFASSPSVSIPIAPPNSLVVFYSDYGDLGKVQIILPELRASDKVIDAEFDDILEFVRVVMRRRKLARAAQAMSAREGHDAQRHGAKPASAVRQDAPDLQQPQGVSE